MADLFRAFPPRTGRALWMDDSPAGQILRVEFFGAQDIAGQASVAISLDAAGAAQAVIDGAANAGPAIVSTGSAEAVVAGAASGTPMVSSAADADVPVSGSAFGAIVPSAPAAGLATAPDRTPTIRVQGSSRPIVVLGRVTGAVSYQGQAGAVSVPVRVAGHHQAAGRCAPVVVSGVWRAA